MSQEMERNKKEIYILAGIIKENVKGRKIILWGDSPMLRNVLKEKYNLEVAFVVTVLQNLVNGRNIRHLEDIRGKSKEFYLVSWGRAYDFYYGKIEKEYGYQEISDFVYRRIKPIVIENWDCSKKEYSDCYGNVIKANSGILKKVVFRGYNNEILVENNVSNLQNVEIDLCANEKITISGGVKFNRNVKFELNGYEGYSTVFIGRNCRFDISKFRLFNHSYGSSVLINDNCTFEENVDFRANSGKRIIIGNDCMFSRNIQLQCGDGHSIFDIKTGKNVNTLFRPENTEKNHLFVDAHVWVAANSFLLSGTYVGKGSVIGAGAVVKGKYPNNCIIAGNPCKIVKRDIAWGRDGYSEDISCCGSKENIMLTNDTQPALYGKKVLVIGGTRFIGVQLVWELIRRGNDVTIATRGKTKDNFGDKVSRIILDLEDEKIVKNVLRGQYYDVVYNNLAYCSDYVRNILENIQCKKYIQLSSIAVYLNRKENIVEEDFNARNIQLKWNGVDDNYARGKMQAEAAVVQAYSHIPYVLVRIPYVTKTERLYYYCNHVVNSIPMNIKDVNVKYSFVQDIEVGKFLSWIAAQDYVGILNLSSSGNISVSEILNYIEVKTGYKAIIDHKAKEDAPFDKDTFSLNLEKVESIGYKVSNINAWFWKLLDEYIERALREKQKRIEIKQNKQLEKTVKNVSRDKCTGCGACSNICPTDAVLMVVDEEGFLMPVIEKNKCISCGLCKKICPAFSGELNQKDPVSCYALMAEDDLREKSSSGGAFSVLAEKVLEEGGVVAGAVWTNEYNAEQKIIKNKEEIPLLRGSKYVQSDSKKTFKETKEWLNKGVKVLYTGMPCQINGLLCYLQKDYDNLITVDLLCRGNASNELFKKFAKDNYGDQHIKRINFKEKKPLGWGATTAYEFGDGTTEKTNIHNSIWMCAFLANFMDRKSCYSCEFASTKRVGDISIGDFWGIQNYKKELNDNKGTSIVVTNTEKGDKLVKGIGDRCKVLEQVPVEMGVPYNSALSNHVRLSSARERFFNNIKKLPLPAAVDRTMYGKKYDVGIVGWWYNLNYGGTITYYALNKVIQKMGYSVLMIRRGSSGPTMPNDNTIPMIFSKKYYNISRLYTHRDMHWLNYSCKAFVSGSDQLWNPYLEAYAGPEYFLSFVNEHNVKVSYASSFGNIEGVSEDFRKKYQPLLDRFSGISVREDYAVDICEKDFEIQAKHVCDPVFLCDKLDFIELSKESKQEYPEKFLVNFLLDPNAEKVEGYKYVQEKIGLKECTNLTDLQNVEERVKNFQGEKVFANIGIEDFLKAYVNAEFVVTDSFHGTCLAIIFNKPFISIANKERGEKRFKSLLKWLGLEHRMVYDIKEIYKRTELLEEIDFTPVNRIIENSKNEGIEWLKGHLSKMM